MGGEPFLRKDIKEIVSYAKSLGFHVTFFTNGFLLKQKAKEIADYVDRLIVSLDFPDKRHDKARSLANLFERIKEGIKEFKSLEPRAEINLDCIMTQLNKGCVKPMAEFAKKHDVFVTFGGLIVEDSNRHLSLSKDEMGKIGRQIKFYKKKGYPILNSIASLNLMIRGSSRNFCAYTRTVLSINADGLINPSCAITHKNNDNILSENLADYLSSKNYKQFQQKTKNCTHCMGCILLQEGAEIWSLNPRAFIDSLKYHL